MLRYRGYGWAFRGLNLQGNYHATTLGAPPLSSGGTGLWGDSANRCTIGLEIQGQQSGIGTGKIVAETLAIHHCVTAIKCLATPAEDNADQLLIGRLVTSGCDTGLLVQNEQSVGINIGNYETGNVTTAIHYEASGKLHIDQLSQQAYCSTGLKIDGDSTKVTVDTAPFTINQLYIDAGAPIDCKAVDVTAAANTSWTAIKIGYLSVSAQRAAASPVTPLFQLRRSTRLSIEGGINLYEGMVKVTGGVATHFPCVRLSNCDMESGASPYNIFSSDSSGKAMLEVHSCCEFYSSGAGQLGLFYRNRQYTWQDGTLTEINT